MRIRGVLVVLYLSIMSIYCESQKNIVIIGHRGAKGHLAENTLPSIAKAIDLGVNGIEIDVFKCASGELVVFHDKTLEDLTNASGYIEDLDLDSIQRIEVLDGYSIPTLNEVMDLIQGKVFLNIELKGSQTAIETNSLLEEYFDKEEWSSEKILISSFIWEELKKFRQINKEVPIAILTEDDPIDAIPIGLELDAVSINPDYETLNDENIQKIQKNGFKIYPWTVNAPKDIRLLIDKGVDGIITDFPERIVK